MENAKKIHAAVAPEIYSLSYYKKLRKSMGIGEEDEETQLLRINNLLEESGLPPFILLIERHPVNGKDLNLQEVVSTLLSVVGTVPNKRVIMVPTKIHSITTKVTYTVSVIPVTTGGMPKMILNMKPELSLTDTMRKLWQRMRNG
jgi:hypothetical protein